MRRLILNADDFGLTRGINRAVTELNEAGALTSATLMASGPAFDDAVALAKRSDRLGVGCHVVLTDGTPVLPGASIASLLAKDRPDLKNRLTFRPSLLAFVAAVLLGRVREAEVALEAEAQIRLLQQAGLHVTHVDTHKHTHVLPLVARGVMTAMQRTGVRAMRNPFEPAWSLRLGPASWLRRLQLILAGRMRSRFEQLPALREGRVLTTDGTIGVSATGHLDLQVLRSLLEQMPEGTWELVTHPGYNDEDLAAISTRLRETRDVERLALLQEFGGATGKPQSHAPGQAGVALIHFGQLAELAEAEAPGW